MDWTRNAAPVPLGQIRFAKDRFFGLGPDGSIYSSSDGEEWILRKAGAENSVLSDVVFGNGAFVAVGRQNWRALVLTSLNGENWELAPQPPDEADNQGGGAAFGNGVFIVAAEYDNFALRGGRIWRSLDGYHWENRYLPGATLNDVAFGNGSFIVVGSDGAAFVSTDGEAWTKASTGTGNHLEEIVHTDSGFLAVARRASKELIQSPDGVNWKHWDHTRGLWIDVAEVLFAQRQFVAVGGDSAGGQILHSTDGATWRTADTASEPGHLLGLTYGQDQYVAVGSREIWISANGRSWRPSIQSTSYLLWDIAADDTVFVAVGETRPQQAVLLRSAEGDVWESIVGVEDLPVIYTVTRGPRQFVALAPRAALTSAEGKNWTRHPLNEDHPMKDIAFANGRYVAVGTRAIATSTDGADWHFQYDARFPGFRGVFWDGGRWIACGRQAEGYPRVSTMWESADGLTWIPENWTGSLESIAFGNGVYVAGGVAGGTGLYRSLPAPPRLQSRRLAEQQVSVTVEATPEAQLILERSPDLRNWTPWSVIIPAGGSISLIDHSSQATQFYRARQVTEP
jgi:hypothetical protein